MDDSPTDLPVVSGLPDWQKLMDTLFPEGRHIMRDVLGNEYPVRTTLPARREVELIRKLSEVSKLPAGDWATQIAAGGTTNTGMITSILAVVAKLAGDPRVLDLLCEAVAIAHPSVLPAALLKIRASEDGAALLAGVDAPTFADVFDVTELVQCLLPFVLRPASKAMGALKMLPLHPTT